jgi:cysteine-S-conjugate beta-lyase
LTDLFNKQISRVGTQSLKFDGRIQNFGTENVEPMWVADMDFAAPDAVTKAIEARALHPIYGYSIAPDSLFDALIDWMYLHHRWEIKREWIVLTPGVVPSLNTSVLALTQKNDGVIVQPPVYPPFFSAAKNSGRRLIENPLMLKADWLGNEQYEIDFEHLELCAKNAKMLLLCSPHNPVGRVWTKEELTRLLDIAKRNDLIVLSDEIHADLVYSDAKQFSLNTLADDSHQIVTAVAPSKTFNIPGLGLSALIVPNKIHRSAIQSYFNKMGISVNNPFSLIAFEAAYREGGDWLKALMTYLQATRDEVMAYVEKYLPEITIIKAQATYLLWMDCRRLGLSDQKLEQFFIQEAKIGLSPGVFFGHGGEGFMRINIGAPNANVMSALARIRMALNNLPAKQE